TMNSRKAKTDDPSNRAGSGSFGELRILRTTIREDEGRAACRHDVHRHGATRIRVRELRVPLRAAILDARGAVGIPSVDTYRLTAIEWLHRARNGDTLAPV